MQRAILAVLNWTPRKLRAATTVLVLVLLTAGAHVMAACPFDLDGDGEVRATSDGMLALRLMAGASDAALRTSVAVAATTPRMTVDAMRSFAGVQLLAFDFDGDGRVLAQTDGAMLLRWMLGVRGEALVMAATAGSAPRTSAADVESFINNGCLPVGSSKAFTTSAATFNTPERGFWRWLTDANSDFSGITATQPDWLTSNGITIGYAPVRLDTFRNASLTPAFLAQLQTAFDHARLGGVKLMLRFAYNYPANETEYLNALDAPLARVLEHITQLTPLIAANADIITVWQAGFIGAWGEGHTSSNGLESAANKLTIRDALLAAAPPGMALQWRYPPDLMAWSVTAATGADAFSSLAKARIGIHNDCFMASATDVGTYDENASVRAVQRAYTAAQSAVTPFHVETCAASPATRRSTCADILAEGPQFHVTGINRDYDTAFHTQWQIEGCFAEIEQKQGYRLELLRAVLPPVLQRGVAAAAQIDLRNTGWARVHRQRSATLELVRAGDTIVATTTADLRYALPNGGTFTLPFVVNPSQALPAGSYRAWLRFADPSARLATDARFSLRPAVADEAPGGAHWDAVQGRFDLGVDVNIQ